MRSFVKNILLLFIFLFLPIISFAQDFHPAADMEMKSLEKEFAISKVTYPGDSSIDVTYYKLNLKVTYEPNYLIGIVQVNAKPAGSSNLSNFFLDLQDPLTVDSVKLGNTKLSFTHQNAKLNISLDKTYSSNEEFSVTIYYQGTPGSSGFGSFQFATQDGTENGIPVIWSLSEPYGASDWWPCKDTPADKADSSDVWITCDAAFTGVSNGTLISIVDNGHSTRTFKWKNSYPIAQYLISIAVTNYEEYINYFKYSQNDSMPVNHYLYQGKLSSIKTQLDETPNMIKVFSEKYGMYPFIKEKYGHAEFGWGGAMEHQTCTSMGPNAFRRDVISHELAHQWFGDKVTCKDWRDIWLNEGFAKYSESIYLEAIGGESAYKNKTATEMGFALNAVGSIYVQDISSVGSIFDYNRTYAKGSIVLHMLRGIVGDDTFFNILKSYNSDPQLAYNSATTEDFQRVAESVSGLDLNYFFSEWIHGENYPSYTYNWNTNQLSANNFEVTLNISQSTNTNPVYFTMPIQIKINTASGDTLLTVMNNQQQQQFKIILTAQPTNLSFDPNNWILKKDSLMVTSANENFNIKTFKLEQNYPNPFNPSTKIKYAIPIANNPLQGGVRGGLVQLKVYDVLGNEVATLVNKNQQPGNYEVEFNAANLSSGVYFYQLKSGEFIQTKKMILMK